MISVMQVEPVVLAGTPVTEKRKHWTVSAGSTPSPVAKVIRMGSNEDEKTEMQNMFLEVHDEDSASQAMVKFETLEPDDRITSMFRLLLDMKCKADGNTDKLHEVSGLQAECVNLKRDIREAHGKIARLDNKVIKLEKQQEELEWREMRNSLIFYNIDEKDGENCKHLVNTVMTKQMKISTEDIYSQENLKGEIRMDIVHRLGLKGRDVSKPHPIVVTFVTRDGKNKVMENTGNLKGKKYSVSEQLPSAMRERRSAAVRKMIEMKKEGSGADLKVKKDTLYINKQPAPSLFEANPLPPSTKNQCSMQYEAMTHTDITKIKGSCFQGHATGIHTVEEATLAREALFQNIHVAKANSLMYAYQVSEEHRTISGFSDDREWCAGGLLSKILEEGNHTNIFVAVSRVHEGPNLGVARFDHITTAAKEALRQDLLMPRNMTLG